MLLCDDPSSTRICATLELPGLEKDDLVVEREGDRLIVSGERKSPIPPDCDPARYPIQEIKYGKYRRAIDLAPGTLVSSQYPPLLRNPLTNCPYFSFLGQHAVIYAEGRDARNHMAT